MNGITNNVTGQKFALVGGEGNGKAPKAGKAAAGQKITDENEETTATNRASDPAYQVEISEEALRKAKEFIEQICKQQGIDIDSLDGPFSSLHAEEVAERPKLNKVITGEDLVRRDLERTVEEFLRKSDENGGLIESEDMFDSLIFGLNGYNGYEGDMSFFDKVLEDLQKKDPEGKSDIISKMKDLFEEAQSGQYIFTKTTRLAREQRIKSVEKDIEANDSQIEAMQEKLKKLNEKLLVLQKEALPDEEKRSKTKPIEKQIESINEQLAKLYAMQRGLSEDLVEVSAIPQLR